VVDDRRASSVSFSPPKRGEGRDEGVSHTPKGVTFHCCQNDIFNLPTVMNHTLVVAVVLLLCCWLEEEEEEFAAINVERDKES